MARPECAKCTYSPCGYIYGHDCPGFRPKDEAPATDKNFGDCYECIHYPERARDEPCASCKVGSAWVQAPKDAPATGKDDKCPRCGGQEVVRVDYDEWITCPDCNGTGKKAEK